MEGERILSEENMQMRWKRKLKNFKQLPSIVVIMLLVLSIPVGLFLNKQIRQRLGAAPGNTVLTVLPINATIGVGETSDLSVWVDPGGDSVTSLQLAMTYDPTVIQVVDVVPSHFFTDPSATVGQPQVLQKNIATAGQIVYAVGFPLGTPYSSTAVAEAVKITVKGLKQGSTQLAFAPVGIAVTKTTDPNGTTTLKTATGNTVNVAGGVRLSYGTPNPGSPEKIGTSFTLPVILNTNSQSVDAVDAIVRFDPAVFTVNSVVKDANSGFSSYPALTINNTAGTVTISANVGSGATVTPVNGANISLAALTITPKVNTSASQFTFDFTAGSRNDSNVLAHVTTSGQEPADILAAVSPTSFVVGGTASSTPTATATPTASPTPTPAPTGTGLPVLGGSGTPTPRVTPTATPIPTVAPTASPTPSPVAQSVTMSLKLQGRTRTGANVASSVTLSYRKAGAAVSTATTITLTPNTSSQVTASMLPGSYVILVKAPGYLPRRFGSDASPIVLTTSTSTLDLTTASLLGGDFNGDGIVNEVDYTLNFLTSFAKTDNTVDLDGSGQVNNLDYGVMRSNWSLQGDTL